ncbi:MAG: hypothetical protein ABL907_11410 [Hyphomicrobium sp.]
MSIENDDQVEKAVLVWLAHGDVPKEALSVEEDEGRDDDGEPEPHPDFGVGNQEFYVVSVTVRLRKLRLVDPPVVADRSGSAAEDDDD